MNLLHSDDDILSIFNIDTSTTTTETGSMSRFCDFRSDCNNTKIGTEWNDAYDVTSSATNDMWQNINHDNWCAEMQRKKQQDYFER